MKKGCKKSIALLLTLALLMALCLTAVACDGDNITVRYVYGNGQADVSVIVEDGGTAPTPATPEWTGHSFLCWTKQGEDTPYDFSTPVHSDLVLTAKWTDSTVMHTVTFELYDGSTTKVSKTVPDGGLVTPETMSRPGFIFRHWALKGQNQETAFNFQTPITSDITLVGVWRRDAQGNKVTVSIQGEGAIFDGIEDGDLFDVNMTIEFSAKVSVYYTGNMTIKVNGVQLETGQNGKYSYKVTTDTTIFVEGLTEASGDFTGEGTEQNPYVISTPAQWRSAVSKINSAQTRYRSADYKLGADLDFQGEQLDAIGVFVSGSSTYDIPFTGTIDGDGHAIKNYAMKQLHPLIDDYTVGDGISQGIVAHLSFPGAVTNLTVQSDLDIVVPALISDSGVTTYIYGGIVGYNMAGTIYNCSFEGDVNVSNSTCDIRSSNAVYFGMIAGFSQGLTYSVYTYEGEIEFCYAEGDITSDGEYALYGVGGIAGALVGTSTDSPAYAANSAYVGNIVGKIVKAGGIVGFLRANASVVNSYTKGSVSSQFDATADNIFLYENEWSAAGAIAGVAENETAVVDCFSTATVTRSGRPIDELGTVGKLIGLNVRDHWSDAETLKAVEINSYYATDGIHEDKNLNNYDDMLEVMGWKNFEWDADTMRPTASAEDLNIAIDFQFGENVTYEGTNGQPLTQTSETVTANDYIRLSYVFGDGYNTIVADSGHISYGFFFDEERTEHIPASMIITHNMTVYVGFADYNAVEGEYYATIRHYQGLGSTDYKVVLDNNGKATLTKGGMEASYMYTYDGNGGLVLFGVMLVSDAYGQNFGAINMRGVVQKDGSIQLTNDIFFGEGLMFGSIDVGPVMAYKKTAAIGDWYGSGGSIVYSFKGNRTGSRSDNGTITQVFTYTVDGDNITITSGQTREIGTLEQDGMTMTIGGQEVSKYDIFKGNWESDFANMKKAVFDGKGGLTIDGTTYQYTVEENIAVFTGAENANCNAYFNEDGHLIIENLQTGASTLYGRTGSYIGIWKDPSYDYEIHFLGIAVDGVGRAVDSRGFNLTYDYDQSREENFASLTIYYRTMTYGTGYWAPNQKDPEKEGILEMAMFTPNTQFGNALIDDYNLTYADPFYGVWNGVDETRLDFNGDGAYDINMPSGIWTIIGNVEVTKGAETQTVRYNFDRTTVTATFTYDGKQYTAALTNDGMQLTVAGGQPVDFKHPDAISNYRYHGGGYVLSFDGRSNVGHGKATVTKDGQSQTYDYIYDGQKAELKRDGTTVYTIDIVTQGNVLTEMTLSGNGIADGIQLGLVHDMMGKVYGLSGGVEIDFTQLFDISGHAIAQFNNLQLDAYYMDEQFVTLAIDNVPMYYVMVRNGETIFVLDDEFTVVAAGAVLDGWQGIYTALDVTNFTLELDGLSKLNVAYDEDNQPAGLSLALYTEYIDYGDGPEANVRRLTYKVESDKLVLYMSSTKYNDDGSAYYELTERYYVYFTQHEGATEFAKGETKIYLVQAA